MTRTLITGTTVFDGSGGDPRTADVLIEDGHIAAVEPEIRTDADVRVDLPGMALSPGLIDMHSHADFTMPLFPEAANSLAQGVTSEVVGNCGSSPAPLGPEGSEQREVWLATRARSKNLDWTWTTFGEFLDSVGRPSVNAVPLVGHGAVRTATFGIEDRPPTPQELVTMRTLVGEALDAGAWGMSSGLVYPPGRYADSAEVEELAAVVAARGGLYSSHMRNESAALDEAVEEALAVGRRTGVRVEISHLKAAGPANHGKVAGALAAIERARAEGVEVGCDAYPYTASSTSLTQLLPWWAMVGGATGAIERLQSEEMRDRIRREIASDPTGYLNASGGWGAVMVAAVSSDNLRHYEGRMLPELAAAEGKDEADFLFDLLVADRARTNMILFVMDPEDVDSVLDHPATVIGSDQLGVYSAEARTHPRAYGTFARVLRRAADKGDAALADTVSRASGQTARRLGMTDRGFVRPGLVADLVVFDPATVRDNATFERPTELASGISQVYIAGQLAFADGAIVAPDLGQVLRRPQ